MKVVECMHRMRGVWLRVKRNAALGQIRIFFVPHSKIGLVPLGLHLPTYGRRWLCLNGEASLSPPYAQARNVAERVCQASGCDWLV